MRTPRFSINESLWVCGGARTREILYPRAETAALRERGAEVFCSTAQRTRRDWKNWAAGRGKATGTSF